MEVAVWTRRPGRYNLHPRPTRAVIVNAESGPVRSSHFGAVQESRDTAYVGVYYPDAHLSPKIEQHVTPGAIKGPWAEVKAQYDAEEAERQKWDEERRAQAKREGADRKARWALLIDHHVTGRGEALAHAFRYVDSSTSITLTLDDLELLLHDANTCPKCDGGHACKLGKATGVRDTCAKCPDEKEGKVAS